MNVDHQHVGWYQSSQFGNFLSPQLLESQFSYQTSIEESVCLIFGIMWIRTCVNLMYQCLNNCLF